MKLHPGLPLAALIISVASVAQDAKPAMIPTLGRLTDPQAEALAQEALSSKDVETQKRIMKRLEAHHFKSTKAKEREFVLYAMGILQDRLESPMKAAGTLKKLERTWPKSSFLGEAQVIMGTDAAEKRRFGDAEIRLRRALNADIPVESKRRAQEMLLWTFVEQGRPLDGIEIIRSLHPLAGGTPSEKGLVAIMETLCAMKDKDGADGTRRSYQFFYSRGDYAPRIELAWALLMGSLGDTKTSAEEMRRVSNTYPSSAQADEARLALATILSEGKLPKPDTSSFEDPAKLLSEMKRAAADTPAGRQALLVRMRIHLNNSQWNEVMAVAAVLRSLRLLSTEAMTTSQLRADAFRNWAKDLLPKSQPGPLLNYLDRDAVNCLAKDQRRDLIRLLAEKGLGSAAKTVLDLAPQTERPELRRIALSVADPAGDAKSILGMLPPKGESPTESLVRAKAEIALGNWPSAQSALNRAKPGAERIHAILQLLRRPIDEEESPNARLREAEVWLARSTEKGADREPLIILVADLKAKAGKWKEALTLYPDKVSDANKGWVALMRATCQMKLGQMDAAKATLKAAINEAAFRMERNTLGKHLGVEL